MNKIYKLIWSKAKNCWVVASELAKGHGKNKSRVKNSLLAAFVMSALLAGGVADVQALTQQEKDEIKNEVALDLLDKIAHGGEIPGAKAEYGPTNFPDAIANRIFYYNDVSSKIGEKLKKDGLTLRYFSVRPDYIEPSRDYLNRYADTKWTNVDNDGAYGAHSMALGYRAFSEAKHGVAIGREALAGGYHRDNSYGGDGDVAIGNMAWALGDKAVSIGDKAISADKSIAIGIQAEAGANKNDPKSIQRDPETNLPYVVSDIAKMNSAIAIGRDTKAWGHQSVSIGGSAKATGKYALSFGNSAEASAMDSFAFGNYASAKGIGAIAIGSNYDQSSDAAKAYSGDTIAIGRGAMAGDENDTTTQYNTIAIGPNAKAKPNYANKKVTDAVLVGANTAVSDEGGTAVGSGTVAFGTNATALGHEAKAIYDNSVVLGANARADIADGVALGSESQVKDDYFGGKAGRYGYDPFDEGRKQESPTWKSTKAAVSVGDRDKKITRQIINVAAGTESTDAVNVAQLKNLKYRAEADLEAAEKRLKQGIQKNAGNISNLSTKVAGNTSNINYLKNQREKDINNLQQSIEGHTTRFVSINKKYTSDKSPNYRNTGAQAAGSIAIGVNAASDGEDAVTLGGNSFSRGQGSVIVGESSDNYNGGSETVKEGQFDQSIILGSNNTIFAQDAENGGREDKIIGNMNRVEESHGTSVRGTGNFVHNAYNDEALTDEDKQKEQDFLDPIDGGDPRGLFQKGRSHVSVDGDGNLVADAIYTQVSGVGNDISSSDGKSRMSYNIVTGNRNILTDSSHNLIMGDNHELENVNGNIIIGSQKQKTKTEKSNVTILGNDANVSVEGGVALGTGSVASTAAEVAGYDPLTGEASAKTTSTWKSGNGAVSVGTADKTRQITNLAAGTADTDAVNVAQLKALNTKVDNGAIHYFSVNSDDSAKPAGTNWNNDGAKGMDAVAIGSSAKAMREFTTAVGAKTAAAGRGANAYGGGIAAGKGTVAIGQNAVAASKPGITQEEYDALTRSQKTSYISDNNGLYYQYQHRDQSGKRTEDEQNYNIAIGSGAASYANQTVSLGYKAKSDVDGGVAIGAGSSANRQAGGIGYIATGSSATFEDALTTLNQKEDYDNWTAIVDDASKKEYDNLTRKFDLARTKESKDKAKAALDAWKEQHADFVEALAAKEKLEATWKATTAAVSVGKDEINEAGNRVIASRQITNVAAGTEDTDAVNVAQLKTAKTTVKAGDYVTVSEGTNADGGKEYTVTGPKLAAKTGDTNIVVEDDVEEATKKKVGYKLSLNKTLTGFESITSDTFKSGDNVTINKEGLTINGGPSMTTTGIDAGNKKITNVAAGTEKTDAVNVEQLDNVANKVNTNTTNIAANKAAIEKNAGDIAANKTAIEKNAGDIAANKTAIEKNAGDIATNKTAIEKNAGDIAANKMAIEKNAGDIAANKTAIEKNAGDIAANKTAIEKNAGDIAANKTAIEKNAGDIAANKTAIEKNTKDIATKMTSWKLKAEDVAGEEEIKDGNEVTFGVVEKDKGLTVTREGGTIKYGIEGDKIDISKNESITGLKKEIEESKVTLEGDDTTGIVVTPEKKDGKPTNYKISLGDKAKVGDVTIDGTKGKGSISGLSEVKVGDDVKLDKEGLTINGGPSMTKGGINAGDKKITNVKDGDISENSKDAVNGGQLYKVDNKVNINSQNISILGNKMGELGNRVNRVGAGAAALAALHPLDFDPDDKWDFAAGYGNYKGANAAAIGAYYRPNEDTMVSVGGSFGGGENMVNAGVSVKLGQGNHVTTSRVAMAKEIKDLRAEVEVLRQAVTGIGQGQTPDPVKMKLFPDIAKNHWAYEAVEELTKQGLLEGYPDGTFGGDRMMTRYEFAEIVYRAMQKGLNVNEKLIQEFEPELERFRIDVISKDKNGNPVIERVRVNEKKKAK